MQDGSSSTTLNKREKITSIYQIILTLFDQITSSEFKEYCLIKEKAGLLELHLPPKSQPIFLTDLTAELLQQILEIFNQYDYKFNNDSYLFTNRKYHQITKIISDKNHISLWYLYRLCYGLKCQYLYDKGNFEFPLLSISLEQAKNDFNTLKKNVGQRSIDEIHDFNDDDKIPSESRAGSKAIDFFTQNIRLDTKSKFSKKGLSPKQACNSLTYLGMMRTVSKTLTSAKTRNINVGAIRNRLVQSHGVSPFNAGTVSLIIKLLNLKYQANIKSYLDLSGGWGNRMLAAYACHEFGVNRYVMTDPNSNLLSAYQGVQKAFEPQGFETIIYQKPMEDLTKKQLAPNGRKNDLMYTSPPFFNLEKYEGGEQSRSRYQNYESWKNCFLYKMVEQTLNGLNIGGFILINIGKVQQSYKVAYHPEKDLLTHLKEHRYIKVIGQYRGRVKDNKTIVARFVEESPKISMQEYSLYSSSLSSTNTKLSKDENDAAEQLIRLSSKSPTKFSTQALMPDHERGQKRKRKNLDDYQGRSTKKCKHYSATSHFEKTFFNPVSNKKFTLHQTQCSNKAGGYTKKTRYIDVTIGYTL